MLINSICKKDENYYPKVFFKRSIRKNLFWQKFKKFWFLGLWKFLLKYKKF